jgi:hypothetical protein
MTSVLFRLGNTQSSTSTASADPVEASWGTLLDLMPISLRMLNPCTRASVRVEAATIASR